MASSETMEFFFPAPSSLPSPLVPRTLFGCTPESLTTLREKLIENHQKYHIFFSDAGFHNHISHHLLALWAFGAPASTIASAYDKGAELQRPISHGVTPDVEDITEANFSDHLGDSRYYNSYVQFFASAVQSLGAVEAVEKFVFSPAYNVDPARAAQGKTQPAMLQHHLAGFYHPMIHVGYGLEYGLPGLVVEGLAQGAVHKAEPNQLIPDALFTEQASKLGHVTAKISSLVINSALKPSRPSSTGTGTHALNILGRILSDPFYKLDGFLIFPTEAEFTRYGDRINDLAEEWIGGIDVQDKKVLEKKMEEVMWMTCLMYGVGGWKEGQDFIGDFFTMHLVTSSIFLPSHVVLLSPNSSYILLRSFFSLSVFLWILRGRPSIDLIAFYKATAETNAASTLNPWFPIIENSISHPDEHLPKVQRALAHYSTVYGANTFVHDKSISELEGASEILDGTLFIRIARLTMEKMEKGKETAGLVLSGMSQWDMPGLDLKSMTG